MADPWLSIIGLGEDGPAGLSEASRAALGQATRVFGATRHLSLAGIDPARAAEWPIPFDLAPLLARRGEPTAMLVSGDPFWFGAGGSIAAHLATSEWQAHPVAGTFSLFAARMGWRLEDTLCLGLHAAPFTRLRPVLSRGTRALCTLRDPAALADLQSYLNANGFAAARLTVGEALGGPRERLRPASDVTPGDLTAPLAVAIDGSDLPHTAGLPRASGLLDDLFANDGQITRRPVRALTLSALAPRPGERLWDIGAGSGSISVEWCLAGGTSHAVEARPDRAANIRANAAAFGIEHRLTVTEGTAPAVLAALPTPDAVFIGGGGDAALHAHLWNTLPPGTRLVANGVTLETEATLAACHAAHGGHLLRIDLAEATPLGRFHGWNAARPVVQWSVTR
ncbi:MAG: precorrin-6y C5,15-methyltransferase (decarboxylating) subunit CbiE [Rhodobacteraceae bacterium]|nr:precorrin-6y C5,15-methyltransferase (decarboxylating) subunit CbiE [Paracoccaceae bacterium]